MSSSAKHASTQCHSQVYIPLVPTGFSDFKHSLCNPRILAAIVFQIDWWKIFAAAGSTSSLRRIIEAARARAIALDTERVLGFPVDGYACGSNRTRRNFMN